MFWPAGGYPAFYYWLLGKPVEGSIFVDTISRRRVGASRAFVEVEAVGQGIHIGVRALALVPIAVASAFGRKLTSGKSYADLRPYQWASSPLNRPSQAPTGMQTQQDENAELEAQYLLTLKGES